MSTYETVLYMINTYVEVWTHIAQYESYVNIQNNTVHYKSIYRHMDHMSTYETMLHIIHPCVDI